MNASSTLLPEWSPQAAVLLTWPHGHGDWDRYLEAVEGNFVEFAYAIQRYESVTVNVLDPAQGRRVQDLLRARGADPARIRCVVNPSNDIWIRDYGPLCKAGPGGVELLDFVFNGWGAKYAHDLDDRISAKLGEQGAFAGAIPRRIELVLEGGSIESDGAGTLLTTRQCLLAPSRNPGISPSQLEHQLKELLGIDRLLWLDHGHLAGDDTDGHVDNLARFCSADTIAHAVCTADDKEHYAALQRMAEELADFTTKDGRGYRLVSLPLPAAILDHEGRRLPASYCNFLIVNQAVLVPRYEDPADEIAVARLQDCFPDREIVPIPSRGLVTQFGSLHCASMQIPAVVTRRT